MYTNHNHPWLTTTPSSIASRERTTEKRTSVFVACSRHARVSVYHRRERKITTAVDNMLLSFQAYYMTTYIHTYIHICVKKAQG